MRSSDISGLIAGRGLARVSSLDNVCAHSGAFIVSLLHCIGLAQFSYCFVSFLYSGVEPVMQVSDGDEKIFPALCCGTCECGISKVAHITNTSPLFLCLDLSFKIGRHLLELVNHLLECGNLLHFLFGVKALKTQYGLANFHFETPTHCLLALLQIKKYANAYNLLFYSVFLQVFVFDAMAQAGLPDVERAIMNRHQ